MAAPEISVVVPSHNRPLRLRWLLNALEEQTLDRERWEVVVAPDSSGPETGELLRDHPLAAAGVLRELAFEPDRYPVASRRNAGWRAARAPLVAFTDDDCRPPREWLQRALEAARRNPGAVIQGMTLPDPHERLKLRAPWHHTQLILPPRPWAETCNMVYPRELLERLDGFVEEPALEVGDDTDLAIRAREAGAPYVGERAVLTYHAIEATSFLRHLRSLGRWSDVPFVPKRHPGFRAEYPLWIFWKRQHVLLPLALFALARARRHPLALALVLPWALQSAPHYGHSFRGRVRSVLELPAHLAAQLAELVVLLRGSIRHRTLLL